jgi:hypothetical protein
MKMDKEISVIMIAPCGMNCQVCYVHLKKKKPCQGCRGQDEAKPEHCRKCKIKVCAFGLGIDYCIQCPSFPCAVVKRLDKSYRQRYQESLVDNAIRLSNLGANCFLHEEREKWLCRVCGGIVSLHDRVCSECGKKA